MTLRMRRRRQPDQQVGISHGADTDLCEVLLHRRREEVPIPYVHYPEKA